jgi:hypothetical protein
MAADRGPELVGRDEASDDYDLLTYREVAARLSEEIAAESQRVSRLEASGGAAEELDESKRRLALLQSSEQRYQQHAETADVFTRRFGLPPRVSPPRGQ